MASDRQIAANRKNALKSTGPRGAAGKARSAGNSKQHGLASDIGRDVTAFAAADCLAAIISRGGFSRIAAREVAVATIKLKDVQKARAAAVEAVLLGISMSGQFERLLLKLKAIDRYEVRAASKKKRAIRGL